MVALTRKPTKDNVLQLLERILIDCRYYERILNGNDDGIKREPADPGEELDNIKNDLYKFLGEVEYLFNPKTDNKKIILTVGE